MSRPLERRCAPHLRTFALLALGLSLAAPCAMAEPVWQLREAWPAGEPAGFPRATAAIAADGSTTVALSRDGVVESTVIRIDPTGARRWSVVLAARGLRLADCGASVCLAGAGLVGQLDADTGVVRWLQARAGSVLGWEALPGADGGLILIERLGIPAGGFPPSVRVERVMNFSASGIVRHEVAFGTEAPAIAGQLLGHDDDGTLAIWTEVDAALNLLRGDGVLVPVPTPTPLPRRHASSQFQLPGVIGADGVVRYLGDTGAAPGGFGREVALVQAPAAQDANLTPLGILPFPLGSFQGSAYPEIVSLPASATAIGVELRFHAPAPGHYSLMQVDGAGAPQWQRRWTTGVDSHFRALAAQTPGMVLLSQRRDGQTVQRLLTPDGRLAHQRELACTDGSCPFDLAARLLADDELIIAGQAGGEQDPHVVVARWPAVPDPAPAIAIDQAGLAGAWFAPYTVGQGFTLRLFPDGAGGATVFMPWFTFDVGAASGAGSLRWYALQGDVSAGDAEATLAIVERRGGVFGSGPAAAPVVVGRARLRFADCTSGLLEYRFEPDHNGGAEGSIALQPLLPREAACTQADGQVLPAQASYDPALSGHWFDPARDGQGLELARIASGAGDDGLLYGAWFTFDPTPPGNAPDDQHWFTLQGQEALPGGGVRTTIVQTLGGRFDSEPAGAPFPVGEADLLPGPDCSALILRYRFDDTAASGAFRGRSGELPLRRLGACPMPSR